MPENLSVNRPIMRVTPMGNMPRRTSRIVKSSKRARRSR